MSKSLAQDAQIARYELEVPIRATAEKVWAALFDDIGTWWLPDFHMVDPSSSVSFDARPGGGIIETTTDGAGLLWYTVQWIQPAQHVVHLVGHVAPDWGGPATSHLKICIESTDDGCVLRVTDAHQGNIDPKNMESLDSGWRQLFTDGLKAFVEDKG